MGIEKREKLLTKIANLMAKTEENGCTIEESMEAMKMARTLMLKYKIEEDELNVNAKGREVVQIKIEGYNFFKVYLIGLLNVFKEFFGIETYYTTSRNHKKIGTIMGLIEDAKIVETLFKHADSVCVKECRKYLTRYKKANGHLPKNLINDFRLGFIDGLRAKYKAQNQTDEKYELAMVTPKEVIDELSKMNLRSIQPKIKVYDNKEARLAGWKAGNQFGTVAISD